MKGTLDFRVSPLLDPRQRLKEDMLVDALERERVVFLKRLKHAAHAGGANGPQERYIHHFEEANAQFAGIVKLLFPGVKTDDRSQVDDLRAAWAEEMGFEVDSEKWKQLDARWAMLADLNQRARDKMKDVIVLEPL